MSTKSEKSNAPRKSPAPLSDCEVTDPRIRRTRQLLQSALQSLLKAKGLDEISVQDVTEAATVNRATFYDHYQDKFALLEALVASGFHRMLSERQVAYDGTCPSGASALILATCDYLRESRASDEECRQQSAFAPLMDAAVIAAIRRVLVSAVPARPPARRAAGELAAAAASYAIFGGAKEWLSRAPRPDAAEIVPVVLRMVLPILQGLA